jgi:phosphoribosyl-ATP pyrophosphohydrolase/phosphoribosyl-AMP cyclohydrolase
MDCDADCLLIKARPAGPVCHSGSDTCFNETNPGFNLAKLESIIKERKDQPAAASYTSSLFAKGINKIAQKVGEEAVELVIESKDNDRKIRVKQQPAFPLSCIITGKDPAWIVLKPWPPDK